MPASPRLSRLWSSLGLLGLLGLAASCTIYIGDGDDDEPLPCAPDECGPWPDAAPAPDAAGGPGSPCGGFPGLVCGAGLYCDFPENTCGAADELGVCRFVPDACDDLYQPVCGCDGQTYGNACTAAALGVDLDDDGTCDGPTDSFACGHLFCASFTEYCQISYSDVAGYPNDYACRALPAACQSNLDCSCLAGVACGEYCSESGNDLTVGCPGG